ncbi:MAG TPA: ABC transporter substrate-binding protein [Gaiellaceae bacterium]|nr:ABC transporter substrate-binding protein [Gaiellaceae bacterium]
MKRLLPLLAVAALVAVPAAAAHRTGAPPVMQKGKLIVAFGDPAPGFADGHVRGTNFVGGKGYEVDLAKKIAAALKLTPVWKYSPWTGLFNPGAKKFDISFQEATITVQRKKTVDFTSPYMNANQGVLLSKTAKTPHSLADLRKMQTCAQADTTGLDFINTELKPQKQPLHYNTTTAAYQSVANGTCQAFILDVPLILLEKKAHPTRYGAVAGQIVTHEQYGAVLTKGSKLTPIVDGIIKTLTKNGTIAKLQKKWFNVNFNALPKLK